MNSTQLNPQQLAVFDTFGYLYFPIIPQPYTQMGC